jgi:hypothetical protein
LLEWCLFNPLSISRLTISNSLNVDRGDPVESAAIFIGWRITVFHLSGTARRISLKQISVVATSILGEMRGKGLQPSSCLHREVSAQDVKTGKQGINYFQMYA